MKRKQSKMKLMVVALVAFAAGIQSYAAVSVKDVFSALSDISTIATDAQSDVAVSAAAGQAGTDAAAIRDAVAAALVDAQDKAEKLLRALDSQDQDAADSAYEQLMAAVQKAKDALAGKIAAPKKDEEQSETSVGATGGRSSTSLVPNMNKNLSDPAFLQQFQQRQASILQLATAFGGDDRKDRDATPE